MLEREVSIWVREDGKLAVGVYDGQGKYISGTIFMSWEGFLRGGIFFSRLDGYKARVFVRSNS